MKRILTILLASLLFWGCTGTSDLSGVSLGNDQSQVVTVPKDGDIFDIVFYSTQEWTAEISYIGAASGWAELDVTSGNGSSSESRVKFSAQKNETMAKRSARVTISSGTASLEVVCIQEGQPEPVFRILENSADVQADGGTFDVTVEANVEYECTITVDWIREVESKSDDTHVHTFVVDANPIDGLRTATLSFCGNKTCIPFVVNQFGTGKERVLEVDMENLSVDAEGTSAPVTVNVDSNVDWMVESSADWCVVDPVYGMNDGTFTISVAESESYKSRMCIVYVTSSNTDTCEEIIVTQAPLPMDGDVDWVNSEFSHRSLFMRFTADWCGYCPMMATAVEIAQEELPGKIEALSVHGGGSGLQCNASSSLVSYYGISGFPTGLMDGSIEVGNYSDINVTASKIVEAAQKIESDYDVYTGLSWESEVNDDKAVLDMTVYVKQPGSYSVTAYLVEDAIIGYQNGGGSNYEHNGVIRAAFTHTLGDDFETSDECQKKIFSYAVAIPSVCNVENLKIVAFVQRTQGGVTFVDNTASAKVGEMKTLDLE